MRCRGRRQRCSVRRSRCGGHGWSPCSTWPRAPWTWRSCCARALALRLDGNVAVSANGAKRVEDFYALGRGSVQVIHNGVPIAESTVVGPAPASRPNGEIVIGCVGRLDAVKGQDVLIDALPRLPGMRARLVGAGAEEAALRARATSLGVADRVELTGWTDQVSEQLRDVDIYCQPSRYETLGLALIEAMGHGLPCVASATGGVPELLDGGRCGRLVPVGDSAALAKAISRLASDPAAREQLGQRARKRTLAAFTADRMAARYESLWARVLAAPRPGGCGRTRRSPDRAGSGAVLRSLIGDRPQNVDPGRANRRQ
ncbi:glycosyltransferase family 4 protein [Phytohabitans flavus]|uniref:glycosyltransferase family 4 protein n=1 Tax=Phytohabitans flavus TaxID=1076124 RepID=UPI00363AD785